MTSPAGASAPLPRAIAVDWSGAATRADRKIWLAECARDPTAAAGVRVLRLESGRSREEVVAHLVDCVARDANVVIGLDFSFSFPAWFLQAQGCRTAVDGWTLAAREGERWLAECPPPFWGRPGVRRPLLDGGRNEFRQTERRVPAVGGVRPKSTLQVGGAGAVGTGAIRGMPWLRTLRDAGCAIWPFDAPRLPGAALVIELYPRLLTGPVAKRRDEARIAALREQHTALPHAIRRAAAASEDAFDALCSAVGMARRAESFAKLAPATALPELLEGEIWVP